MSSQSGDRMFCARASSNLQNMLKEKNLNGGVPSLSCFGYVTRCISRDVPVHFCPISIGCESSQRCQIAPHQSLPYITSEPSYDMVSIMFRQLRSSDWQLRKENRRTANVGGRYSSSLSTHQLLLDLVPGATHVALRTEKDSSGRKYPSFAKCSLSASVARPSSLHGQIALDLCRPPRNILPKSELQRAPCL
eukprot:6191698-Pleurochrysis_carterae.AAC.1